MSRGPEGAVKDEIKDFLKSIGAWYFMPVMNGYGRKGIPDFIVCWKGCFIGVEVKAPGKKDNLTPWQKHELEDIIEAGGWAYCVDNLRELKQFMYAIQSS